MVNFEPLILRILVRVILPHRARQSLDRELGVVSLLGHKDVWHLIVSLRIFFKLIGQELPVFLISDGTITASDEKLLGRYLDVEVVSRNECDRRMEKVLEKYPNLRRYHEKGRENICFYHVDMMYLHPFRRFIYFEYDVLFYQKPKEVIAWIQGRSRKYLYLSSKIKLNTSSDPLLIYDRFIKSMVKKYLYQDFDLGFNHGLVCFFDKKDICDFKQIDKICNQVFEVLDVEIPTFPEIIVGALLSIRRNTMELPQEKYLVKVEGSDWKKWKRMVEKVCVHFAFETKSIYAVELVWQLWKEFGVGKRLLWKLGLLVVGIVLAVGVLFEMYLRMGEGNYAYAEKIGWQHQRDMMLGWKLEASASGKLVSSAFGSVEIKTNSRGFRDKELVNGKFRIVGVGDSQLFGWGVEANQVFTELLEEEFSELEFVNMAVPGYGADQEYLLMRDQVVKLDPKLVVLVFSGNDIEALGRRYGQDFYQYKPVMIDPEELLFANAYSGERDFEYSYFLERLNKIKIGVCRRIYSCFTVENALDNFWTRRFFISNLDLSKVIMQGMADLWREQEVPFVVIFLESSNDIEKKMSGYLDEIDVSHINLDIYNNDQLYIPRDFHLSEEGHRYVAEQLAKYLMIKPSLIEEP